MKIALPVAEGRLCMHFGHCQEFHFIEVDSNTNEITSQNVLQPPPHEPGVLPAWIHKQGASMVIAGGMGTRAKNLFQQNGVQVVTGAPAHKPKDLVKAYLNGTLQTGANACDH